MNNLFYLLLLLPLIGVPFAYDDSFACDNCEQDEMLRIMAGYDTIIFDGGTYLPTWINHHTTGYFGFSNLSISGSDSVTLDKTEYSLSPHFMVKSYKGKVTADFTVTYQIENPKGKLIKTGSNDYTNILLTSPYDGFSDSFPAVSDIQKHSTITYTLKVTSMR